MSFSGYKFWSQELAHLVSNFDASLRLLYLSLQTGVSRDVT